MNRPFPPAYALRVLLSAALLLLWLLAAPGGSAQPLSTRPPLAWAARNGQLEIARLLIQQGANVNGRDVWGSTPLHLAVGYPDIVDLLIASGANVNLRDGFGNTPLHLAVRQPFDALTVVQKLLKAGAAVNPKNGFDKTPLDYSLQEGTSPRNLRVVETLIKAGAGTAP